MEGLIRRLQVARPVRLYLSTIAEVPIVIGWLRPYILLPVSAVTGLGESQLGAILAHELAHIRRHDYLANLLQNAVETLLFYHPAVWWVSRWIRQEREHCCDDLAVEICGDVMVYAGALAQLEELRGGVSEPALAAAGGGCDCCHDRRRQRARDSCSVAACHRCGSGRAGGECSRYANPDSAGSGGFPRCHSGRRRLPSAQPPVCQNSTRYPSSPTLGT
jgi:hypothetical protein